MVALLGVAGSMTFERLIRIADWLAVIKAGSRVADETLHQAIGRSGPAPLYTTNEAAARMILPPGFEWVTATYAAGRVYARHAAALAATLTRCRFRIMGNGDGPCRYPCAGRRCGLGRRWRRVKAKKEWAASVS